MRLRARLAQLCRIPECAIKFVFMMENDDYFRNLKENHLKAIIVFAENEIIVLLRNFQTTNQKILVDDIGEERTL